ncbi:deaminase domain-containing protein [Gordonia sp. CPCC 206044]|uniref:deaminase domain-containing protein n=1 Tax=Gordonia sp. CPCC 206044 TaxID=3140793 RepID=UPI003AF3B88C
MTEPAREQRPVTDALVTGRRHAAASHPSSTGVTALQRAAGNGAVEALLLGRFRAPGKPEISAALREMRHDEPEIGIVEKGLKAAKAVGVPVELEGPKPPPSALAVTMTGFGPASVESKKPVPPRKPVPPKSPLGAAAAKVARPTGSASAGGVVVGGAPRAPAAPRTSLSADELRAPPVAPQFMPPHRDPEFSAVTTGVATAAATKRAHPRATSKAKEAQDAALAPSDDLAGQAKAAKVDSMDAQQAGAFDKKAFIAAVKAAIEAKSPKTLTEADKFAESGKAGEVKGDVKSLVTQGKDGQSKDIATATAAAPDTGKAVPKPVTPMGPELQGPAPAIPTAGAVPKPAPPEQLNLEAGKQQADQEMTDAQVDETQLAESNEPQFQQALADKQVAAAHADAAPASFRAHEAGVIGTTRTEAAAATTSGIVGMHGSKATALAGLVAAKGKTKSKDEAKRAAVTARVQAIFTETETDVKALLDGLDPKVEKAFDDGEAAARKLFETYVSAKMAAYKKDRYSGWLGGLRWAKDKLVGMPDKVNEFYAAGRELYLKQMDGVITKVADIVAADLGAAKKRIAAGKLQIATYVKSLPADLKKLGTQASSEIGDRFEQLEQDVDAKKDALVDTLATKYTEARKGLDERIEELQAENKGLVDKAIGAIKAVINTIRKLASMLMDTLARVAHVVGDIIKHPIRFLGNLVEGVKGGILRFKENILDHLRKGLMNWLFGALAESGVELPDSFDLQGIVKLLASLFGLTWRNIRSRLVRQIGEPAMAAVEKGVEIFRTIASTGVGGLWQMLVDKLGDIKEMILEQVKDFVVTRVITAGITWLIGLLNPAAAFIKACKLIYDIIMFFVDNAERILAFVNTIIDSAVDIVRGNVSSVVAKIEDALGQMVPVLIGFLASVIGIGGIGQKIRAIVDRLRKPITKALDVVIGAGLKLAGPIIRGVKGIGSKAKEKAAAGKEWVTGKVKAGKEWVKGKLPGATPDHAKGPEVTHRPLEKRFDLKGFGHRVFVPDSGVGGKAMVASNPQPIDQLVRTILAAIALVRDNETDRQRESRENRLAQAQVIAGQIMQLLPFVERPGPETERMHVLGLMSQMIRSLAFKLSSNPVDKPTIRKAREKEVGTAWYDINGERGSVAAISGGGLGVGTGYEQEPLEIEESSETWTPFFQALVIPSKRPRAGQAPKQMPRHTDSEIKILSYVATRFAGLPDRAPSDSFQGNKVYPHVRGSIQLYTNNTTCESCAFVIGQFRRMFPNVEVILGRAQPHRPRRKRERKARR